MAYLTSSSTLAQVNAAYEDNAVYDLTGDVTMAKEFVQACRFLLRRMATKSKAGEAELEKSVEVIEGEMKTALDWVKANDPTFTAAGSRGYVRGADFRDFRS